MLKKMKAKATFQSAVRDPTRPRRTSAAEENLSPEELREVEKTKNPGEEVDHAWKHGEAK